MRIAQGQDCAPTVHFPLSKVRAKPDRILATIVTTTQNFATFYFPTPGKRETGPLSMPASHAEFSNKNVFFLLPGCATAARESTGTVQKPLFGRTINRFLFFYILVDSRPGRLCPFRRKSTFLHLRRFCSPRPKTCPRPAERMSLPHLLFRIFGQSPERAKVSAVYRPDRPRPGVRPDTSPAPRGCLDLPR